MQTQNNMSTIKIIFTFLFGTCVVIPVYSNQYQPFSENSRIAIVGAGPAGIHMASRLKKDGHDDVTILERTHRVGGKSYTLYRDPVTKNECVQKEDESTGSVDTSGCIAHELGTIFLHHGYHTVRDLVKEYGLTPEIHPDGRAIFTQDEASSSFLSQGFSEYVVNSVSDLINQGVVEIPWYVPSFLEPQWALVDAVIRYINLHIDIIGEMKFSMPDRLSAENLERIDTTYLEYLTENNLDVLIAFIEIGQSAQGVGYVSTIPAFYGLLWITPELLHGLLQQTLHETLQGYGLPTNNVVGLSLIKFVVDLLLGKHSRNAVHRMLTVLPEGYNKLWKAMYETDDLTIRFGVSDLSIDRQLHDTETPVKISYSHSETDSVIEEEYDFLIYTAPHSSAHKYVTDLTSGERSIFDKLKSFVLSTTIYKSDAVAGYSDADTDAAIMYNADKLDGPENEGEWHADANAVSYLGPADNEGGGGGTDNQIRVAYQFLENYCEYDQVLCDTDRYPDAFFVEQSDNLTAVLKNNLELQDVQNVDITEQFPWPYFHHFENEAISQGVPWDLFEMQGDSKTWWLGASASFESVHDVVNYNLMIVDEYM